MSFVNIQRRTMLALGLALVLHVAFLFWLQGRELLIEVPLSSQNISTQIGIYQPPAPPIQAKPKVRPVVPPKKAIKPVTRKKTIAKKVMTTQQQKDFAISPPKETMRPAAVAKPAVQAVAKPPASKGGAQAKVAKNEIRKYINRVVRMIDRKKRYPRLAKSNGEQGTVRVKITVGKAGQLIAYRLVGNTPFARLGQATVATIQAAAPFPPLPASYQRSKITIEVPVRFRLARGR